MNTSRPKYVIGYTVFVAAAFATILVLVSRATEGRIRINEEAVEMRAILAALGVEIKENPSSDKIRAVFKERVDPPSIPAPLRGVQPYAIYTGYKEGSREASNLLGYAFPVKGTGMWGPLYGYMAVEPDLVTVLGIIFYKDEETPGLGHEIRKTWFQKAFIGKQYWSPEAVKKAADAMAAAGPDKVSEAVDSILADPANAPGFVFTPATGEGTAGKAYNEVDAVTGATVTTTGVKNLLGGEIIKFLKEMAKRGIYPKAQGQ